MIPEPTFTLDADPTTKVGHSESMSWIDELLQEAYEQAQAPPPIRLTDLLEEIASILRHYLYFSQPATAMLLACWIVMTYCFRDFKYAGYLAIRSKGLGSGKTRLLELLAACCNGNPPIFTNPTAAVLIRGTKRVVLIDEVDRLRGQDKESHALVMSVLNAGFQANGVVPRTERDGPEGRFSVINYPVYGPKAFAGLEKLESTLASRCFHIEMTQAPTRPPRFSLRSFDETATHLRDQLVTWRDKHRKSIAQAYGALPTGLRVLQHYDDRFQDIAEPLVVLAAYADAESGGAQKIMPLLLEGLRLAASQRSPMTGERLGLALQEIFQPLLGDRGEAFVPSKDLLERVQAGGLSWIDSTVDLANTLAPFGLHSRSNGSCHGYDLTKAKLEALNPTRQPQTTH